MKRAAALPDKGVPSLLFVLIGAPKIGLTRFDGYYS